MAPLNPITEHFEFFGPVLGPVGIVIGLPILTFASAFLFREHSWTIGNTTLNDLSRMSMNTLYNAFSPSAFAVYFCWFGALLLLHAVVPGPIAYGTKLRDGRRLPYKLNGWACFLLTHVLLVPVHLYVAPLTWVVDHWLQLVTAMITSSFLGSFMLYAASFSGDKTSLLAAGGNSGVSRLLLSMCASQCLLMRQRASTENAAMHDEYDSSHVLRSEHLSVCMSGCLAKLYRWSWCAECLLH